MCLRKERHRKMNEKQKMKKKETIFLVDDHNILRTSLRLYLEQNGYTVAGEAGNGAETLQMVTACSPDVIVVD
ncbi:MAG: response regulator, partial [Lachnospiraceae bacterium]|nr:response regulator [Lachnospiraceae bacterium]